MHARRISAAPHRSPAPLGANGAGPHLHGGARRRPRLAADHLRGIADLEPAYRIRPVGARPFRREAGRDPFRQFDRPCPDRVRRALCGDSVLPGVAGLFAGVEGLRQAFLSDEAADPRPRLRRRRRQIRRCAAGQCSRRRRDRGRLWRVARTSGDHARRSHGDAAAWRPRRGASGHRSRYDREIPAHVRLDRQSQGRHQHPADALRQPGDDPRDHGVPEGRAAGHRRLAAVESHLWRQPQYRARAVQWRLDVSRRRQADARRHRGNRAQSARGFADGLFQRAEGL